MNKIRKTWLIRVEYYDFVSKEKFVFPNYIVGYEIDISIANRKTVLVDGIEVIYGGEVVSIERMDSDFISEEVIYEKDNNNL